MSKKGDGQRRGTSPANNKLAGVSCEICRQPDDSLMVACDLCGKWFHFVCVGVESSVQDRDWSCKNCAAAGAIVQIPAGTLTSSNTEEAIPKIHEYGPEDSLQRQLAEMQKKAEKTAEGPRASDEGEGRATSEGPQGSASKVR